MAHLTISDDVRLVLHAAETDGNALRLSDHLDRPTYVATAKILAAVGGKWDRKAQAHLFEGDAGQALEQILTTGEYTDKRVELQQFYTPAGLASRLCEMAGVVSRSRVLEPSAGRGALALAARTRSQLPVRCFDIDHTNVAALRSHGFEAKCCDFLATVPARLYDCVVMNPPFAGQADVAHITHALNFLELGGRLAAIASAGVVFRDNRAGIDFRELVSAHGGYIEPLPPGSFKESGTMVNAVVVTLTKQ